MAYSIYSMFSFILYVIGCELAGIPISCPGEL